MEPIKVAANCSRSIRRQFCFCCQTGVHSSSTVQGSSHPHYEPSIYNYWPTPNASETLRGLQTRFAITIGRGVLQLVVR